MSLATTLFHAGFASIVAAAITGLGALLSKTSTATIATVTAVVVGMELYSALGFPGDVTSGLLWPRPPVRGWDSIELALASSLPLLRYAQSEWPGPRSIQTGAASSLALTIGAVADAQNWCYCFTGPFGGDGIVAIGPLLCMNPVYWTSPWSLVALAAAASVTAVAAWRASRAKADRVFPLATIVSIFLICGSVLTRDNGIR